jgi:FtsP/CotA-like multicopper oxidase with cupredoxin domain
LYGVLIVEDPADPDMPDAVWVFDSWDEAPDYADGHTHGPDDTLRDWTVNGLVLPNFSANETTRVRMLNASNMGFLSLPPMRHLGNGQGLFGHEQGDEAILLGPGERADVEWNANAPTALSSTPWAAAGGPAWGEEVPLLTATADGTPDDTWPFSGLSPSGDPGVTDVTWVLQGDGEALGWMINGEQFPYVTIPSVTLDTEAILEVRNLSAAEHPFHLHGMAFEVLSIDGVPPPTKIMADTWNVRIRQAVRLKLLADNPGDWMSHCHILPHQHLGMMTVLRVE